MTVQERLRPAAAWKPEVASLNMGLMKFGLFLSYPQHLQSF